MTITPYTYGDETFTYGKGDPLMLGGARSDGNEATPDHAPYCSNHDDQELDCSSPAVTVHGVSSWLTRTRGVDVAWVASVSISRGGLGELIQRLQHLHSQMS